MKFKNCAEITGPLVALTEEDCLIRLQQAKRIAYQKLGQPIAPAPQFTAQSILLKATWDALLAAVDDKKIILPRKKLYEPDGTPSEAVKVGSNDNSTPDGGSILVGETVPMFSAKYNGLSPTDFSAVEDLFDQGNKNADFESIGMHVFLGDRQVMVMKDFQPIPIKTPFIGTPSWGKLHELTLFNLSFDMPKGWYRDVVIYTLAFNHNLLKN